MQDKVIDNALDFLYSAANNLWDENLSGNQQLKFSSIHLYEGIELLLKARLLQEHWSLIIRDFDKYKKGSFTNGDFISTTFEQSCKRLESFCGFNLERAAYNAFNNLRKLRNKYVHFSCTEPRHAILPIQLAAWQHILKLLKDGFLGQLSDIQNEVLDDVQTSMLRSEEFLNAKFKEVEPAIKAAEDNGLLIASCPNCGVRGMLIGDGSPKCLVCESLPDSPTEVADIYASVNNSFWKHSRHGPDDEVGWCPYCGEQAIVPVGDDIAEVANSQLSNIEREPGEDWEISMCLACGQSVIDWWKHECGYCGAVYFNSDEERYCPECVR